MTKYITLSNGMTTAVDDDDYDHLMQWSWRFSHGYAIRGSGIWPKRTTVSLHRCVIECPAGMHIDHIDGDKLNNQRNNLRVCSRFQNMQNQKTHSDSTSAFKGVSWDKQRHRWMVRIGVNGKQIYVGLFDNEAEAARAYDRAARQHHGEYARLNFPEE